MDSVRVKNTKKRELDWSSWSTQLIYEIWEIEIHNVKISKLVEGKKQLNQVFICEKKCVLEIQRGVLKVEYKWRLHNFLSLVLP